MLKGQAIRSNAGLYYETYGEFAEALDAIVSNPSLRADAWPEWRAPYLHAPLRTGQSSSASIWRRSSRSHKKGRPATPWIRCRGASDAAAPTCPRPRNVLSRIPSGPACHDDARVASTRCSPRSATATLSAMRCSGSSAPCASAGYESEIFVETADPRLEALTRDYRELMDASHPDNLLLHHFSIGSKASRVAFALPDRMALIYHNITPPEYFVGVHGLLAELCFLGRRELRAYVDRCELALGDSEFNRQELAALGFPRTGGAAGRSGLLASGRAARSRSSPPSSTTTWTNIVFVGRVIPNKQIEDLIRIFHAYNAPSIPRSRLLIVGAQGGFEQYRGVLHGLAADARAYRSAHDRPRVRRSSWPRATTSPMSSSAPASTRASACRSMEAFHAASR